MRPTGQLMLSIIIVNWNTREMLRDCLRSVERGLAGDPVQIIVVDNGSSDGSAEMVEAEFSGATLIRNTDNRGFAAANNQGFAVAHGRYTLLLNSDTLVHGDVLQKSVAYMDGHPDVGAMGCRVLNADGTVQLTCSEFPTIFNVFLQATGLWKLPWPRVLGKKLMTHWARDTEREVQVISGCYLMIKSGALTEVGSLDEAFFFFGEETDWCQRARNSGWRLMFAPVGEITHYGGGTVKKLNHKRDVMLMSATLRLNFKHNGRLAAAICWILLEGFLVSRVTYWNLVALATGQQSAKNRACHFQKVLADSFETWPEPKP